MPSRRLSSLRLFAGSWFAALVAVGCGGGPGLETLVCSPVCPSGTHCTSDGCVADGAPPDFAVVHVDQGGGGGCSPACGGTTPFCNPNGDCVACLADNDCPVGSTCKVVGTLTACVPGCVDNSRCGGGTCCAGQCADIATDPSNCGGCGTTCVSVHGGAACQGGQCQAGTCNPGWADCNNDRVDGCETNLAADKNNCGRCNSPCAIANAVSGCSTTCYIEACKFGFGDCNDDPMDGCETDVVSDSKNCGTCGNPCAKPPHGEGTCVNAACRLTKCEVGYADCDGDPANGCEVSIFDDAGNCGACNAACAQGLVCKNGGCTCAKCDFANASSTCANNVCALDKCVTGWDNCNKDPADGCEVHIGVDPANCGACGNVCPQNLPGCVDGVCVDKYLPFGPQQNVDVRELAGWTECFREDFTNGGTNINDLKQKCPGSRWMLACSPTGAKTLSLLAWADQKDVLFDTMGNNITHDANGVGWYFNGDWSWGFAKQGDPIDLQQIGCDTQDSSFQGGKDGDLRMCSFVFFSQISSGWRCGKQDNLDFNFGFDRILYYAN